MDNRLKFLLSTLLSESPEYCAIEIPDNIEEPTGKASAMFKAIPSELTRNSSRYQVANVTDKLSKDLGYVYENVVAQMPGDTLVLFLQHLVGFLEVIKIKEKCRNIFDKS